MAESGLKPIKASLFHREIPENFAIAYQTSLCQALHTAKLCGIRDPEALIILGVYKYPNSEWK